MKKAQDFIQSQIGIHSWLMTEKQCNKELLNASQHMFHMVLELKWGNQECVQKKISKKSKDLLPFTQASVPA